MAATLGVIILKEMFDLTDEAALDNFEFNASWQYALNVEPDEAHVCQKTLHNFRVKMSEAEEQGILTCSALFDEIAGAIIKDKGLKIGKQRLDSTHIRSNMAVLTRLGLFTHTITAFVKKLRKQHPRLFEALPKGIYERYIDREGYFVDSPSSDSRRRLSQCAADVWRLADRFRGHRSVSGMPSYLRLKRLLEEQCAIEDDDPTDPDGDGPEGVPVRPKDPKVEKIPPTPLQGSDDDATYGHKGKGYQAQVAETCDPENEIEVLTHVSVEGAHESDQHATIPVLDDLEQKDCKPDTLLADTNYGRGQNIVDAARCGVDLVSPSCGPKPEAEEGDFILDDFMFSSGGQRIEHRPMGQEPVEQGAQSKGRRDARMDAKRCGRCSWPRRCPARRSDRDTAVTLTWLPSAGATSARRHRERTKEFKDGYRLPSGIEATNSEYKRFYGGGRLRVRGSPAVHRMVKFKFMALNIRRWTNPARKTQNQAA
ncbi:MAG: transposase [Phycisphaerales bacterium]|nr:MAG: transposase [Phycisphaerales bacterium]